MGQEVDQPDCSRGGVQIASGDSTPAPSPGLATPPTPPWIPEHELVCRIGGSYGEVWLARSVLGARRAVKIVHRRSFEESDSFEREFKGLQKFEPISRAHEGLVDILQVGRTEEYLYYVMELADAVDGSEEAVEPRRDGGSSASGARGQIGAANPVVGETAGAGPEGGAGAGGGGAGGRNDLV